MRLRSTHATRDPSLHYKLARTANQLITDHGEVVPCSYPCGGGRVRRRRPRLGGGDVGQVLDDFLRVLSLARPRLARAQDALVLSV